MASFLGDWADYSEPWGVVLGGGQGFWVLSEEPDRSITLLDSAQGLSSHEVVGPAGWAIDLDDTTQHALEEEEAAPPPRPAAMPLQEEARAREALREAFAGVAIRRLGFAPVQLVLAFAGF